MYCPLRKIIFVHIPKCGGTSVEDALWPKRAARNESILWMGFVDPFHNMYQTGGLQHLTASLILSHLGAETFAGSTKFALVRHPIDRAISQYKFMHRRPDLQAFAGLTTGFGFKDYLEATSEARHVQWARQADFLLSPTGEILVDHCFRLEDVARSSAPMAKTLGLPSLQNLDRKNSTDSIPAPILTEDDLVELVKRYRVDFDLLDYPKPILPGGGGEG